VRGEGEIKIHNKETRGISSLQLNQRGGNRNPLISNREGKKKRRGRIIVSKEYEGRGKGTL